LINAARTLAGLDPHELRHAIADYLSAAPTRVVARSGADPGPLGLLLNASALSLSGAVPAGDRGWMVFLTPKKSGWHQAMLFLEKGTDGHLKINSSRLLTLSTAGP
jgi:hypothetical protein